MGAENENQAWELHCLKDHETGEILGPPSIWCDIAQKECMQSTQLSKSEETALLAPNDVAKRKPLDMGK